LNFSAWPDWWRHLQVRSNRFDHPHEVDGNEEPGADGVAAFPRPTSRDCPACQLEVTYAGIISGSRRPCGLTAGRSAGALWLAAPYGVASTVGLWSGLHGVERIWK
jgi:hypothetical protein